jgi:hypothetical protein
LSDKGRSPASTASRRVSQQELRVAGYGPTSGFLFVFLADEENRIELPNRRAGRLGSFARGFFVWNSEVGKTTLGAGFFLFDYVCCNRIIWGADQYTELQADEANYRLLAVGGR